MKDLSNLPSQPEEIKEAPEGTSESAPSIWSTITEEQKAVHINTLIVACVDNIYRNNPVLWIWAPQGSTQEVTKLWIESMTRQLGNTLDPNDPTTQLYFPDVQENDTVAIPSLYTKELKVGNDLLKFTRELADLAEVDINNIHAQIGLDVPSMKGLLLFWRIGMPAMLKRLEQQQQEKAGPKVSKGGILLPH